MNGKFGFWTGWFVVVASMVGSGILTNSGPIVKITQSYPALFLLWFLGGVLALCGALTLAELGSTIQRPGGDYAYVVEAFGRPLGFVFGWAMVVLGFAAPIALVSYTAAAFIGGGLDSLGFNVMGGEYARAFPPLLGSGLIVLFTLLHSLGHKESAWVQSFTTIFKLGTLLGFAGLALVAGTGTQSVAGGAGVSVTSVSLTALASGLVLVMYAYTGWNGAIYLASEMRDVKRDMPKALVWGAGSVTALYLIMNVVYVMAFTAPEMAALSDADMGRLAELAITRLLGPAVGRVFGAAVVLGVLASLSAYILTGPRIVHALALDGLCPRLLGRLNPSNGVPVVATLAQGAIALVLLWSGTFGEILDFTSYGLACLGALIILPIFVFRRRPGYVPVFRVPLYPFTPILFTVVSAAQLIGAAIETPRTAFLSLGSILLGFPLYYAWRKIAVRSTR